jgi:hypothetical protein
MTSLRLKLDFSSNNFHLIRMMDAPDKPGHDKRDGYPCFALKMDAPDKPGHARGMGIHALF